MKRLMIVDVSNFIFRAYYAIRGLNSPDGTPVNAVYGVLQMLMKIFQVYKPTHVLLAKETKGGSFRNELYEQYKANRSEPDEDLIPQFDLIEELTQKMQLPEAKDDNFEADDIIGTICQNWLNDFDEILIASGDKDLMQFVDSKIRMVDTMKDKIYDSDGVYEKMGVKPEQIVDYLSLVGDASDNVPGMKGVGAKGAAKLLSEYGTLDSCIEHKDELKGKRLINAFANHLDDALLSRKLIQIVTDVDLNIKPEDTAFSFKPNDELITYLEKLGFQGIVKRVKEFESKNDASEAGESDSSQAQEVGEEAKQEPLNYHICEGTKELNALIERIKKHKSVTMFLEYTTHEDLFKRRVGIVGIEVEGDISILNFKNENVKAYSSEELFTLLEATWGKSDKLIISPNIKTDLTHAVTIESPFEANYFDISQASFVCDPSNPQELDTLIQKMTGLELPEKEKKEKFLSMDFDRAAEHVAVRVRGLTELKKIFEKELKEKEVEHIYNDIDNPLIEVLAKMERQGIRIDAKFFQKMEKDLQKTLDEIQEKVDAHSAHPVNLNSPKQVSEFLFEELELPVIKKTKTGSSTDSEVLEELASRNISDVPSLILQYREYGKLLSTYVKALPGLINPTSERLHTSFNQNVAQTGRLSSTHPNLQNIPIRTELGRKVRRGFIADKGKVLLGADYSQVELRILAHFANDPTMIKAFKDNIDIHAQTASEILGVDINDVTTEERSKAKAVNFGLMYGQSSFGLAKTLRIPRKEAKAYIDRYFERFDKVKGYLDSLKEEAEKKGYCLTMDGRKRFLPDIHAKNRNVKANAERMAINTPIQGTAADIIKKAMLTIHKQMNDKDLESKMLLQVHDELIFEVPEKEVDEMKVLVKEGMENVASLSVPLTVDMGVATNWFDLK